MSDGGSTGGKRGNGRSIFLRVVGAVLGFVGGLALAPYNRMDPVTSGLTALFVFGPIGASWAPSPARGLACSARR